jgi:hypothetical protein
MYKILFDNHSDGYSFEKEEFETVEKAVKHALGLDRSSPFLIIKIIDWMAVEIS